MRNTMTKERALWVTVGLTFGLLFAYFCPHQPTYATTADRDSQFMMVTVPVGNRAVGIDDPIDGVFILDFLTGQLKGAVMNRQLGKFNAFYVRNLAQDFGVKGEEDPHYCIVTGYAQMPSAGGATFASGMLYVGELTSGKVAAYTFPWNENGTGGAVECFLVDAFSFKAPAKK